MNVSKDIKEIEKFYDEYALTHDAPIFKDEVQIKILSRRIEKIVEFMQPITKDIKILEVGCGTGNVSEVIINFIDFGVFIGVDISDKMLELAREKIRSDKVVFLKGDAQNLQFKDNSFDYVITSEVLEHMQDSKKALSEWSRVLKDSGKIIITIPNRNSVHSLYKKMYGKSKQIIDHPFTVKEIYGLCKKVDLKILEMFALNYLPPSIPWKIKRLFPFFWKISMYIEDHKFLQGIGDTFVIKMVKK